MSLMRQSVVFATCAATIGLVACRQQHSTPPPLQPDAEVAAQLEKRKADQAFYEGAANMTAAEVNALEASLKHTAEDFAALRKLRHFYQVSGQKVFGWNEMIARRRPHILWMIEHHPEHDLAMWPVSAEADPAGYAAAKQRWLARTRKPDASDQVLVNAAGFFARADPAIAEAMLLRARALPVTLERSRGLSSRLGRLYADVIKGETDPRNGAPLNRMDAGAYARDVRRRLLESNDAALLSSAGQMLARTFNDADRQQLGVQLLQRAVQIDPQQQGVHSLLVAIECHDRNQLLTDKLRLRAAALAGDDIGAKVAARQRLTPEERDRLRGAERQALSELPEADRFALLPGLADRDYMQAEMADGNKERPVAEALFARSKKYAQDALALAPRLQDDPDYGKVLYHATVALAAHALREGDKDAAVRYMLEAAKAPPSRGLETRSSDLDRRLVNYLLKEGERESVATFLERSADLRSVEREQLLKDAAAIRAGKMPTWFQYMNSRN